MIGLGVLTPLIDRDTVDEVLARAAFGAWARLLPASTAGVDRAYGRVAAGHP